MPEFINELQELKNHQRFLAEVEQGVRMANREVIHERIPGLTKETFLALAVSVGRLRARHLAAAFALAVNEHGDPPDQAEIADLRNRREMYEEARAAFDSLREAIEKGYIGVETP